MRSDIQNFKEKLNNGEYVYGLFSKTSDPMFIEIMGIAGFDFVILDTEHGPTDIEHQQNNIRACECRGLLPVIRVPYIDDNTIGKAFDIGAQGIQVPQVRTVEDVERIVKYARFHPYGERGVCRFVRAADYSALDRNLYFEKSKELLVILQLEGQEAIKNLSSILEIDGYDIIFIGPYDLSQSLGVTGQIDHPKVIAAMEEIVRKAREKGVIVGTFTDTYEMVEKWKTAGIQYISYSTDSGVFYDALKDVHENLIK